MTKTKDEMYDDAHKAYKAIETPAREVWDKEIKRIDGLPEVYDIIVDWKKYRLIN